MDYEKGFEQGQLVDQHYNPPTGDETDEYIEGWVDGRMEAIRIEDPETADDRVRAEYTLDSGYPSRPAQRPSDGLYAPLVGKREGPGYPSSWCPAPFVACPQCV